MLELPNVGITDVPAYANWVELNSLVSPGGVTSQTDLADAARDLGLVGTSKHDVPPGDETYLDGQNLAEEEGGDRFAEIVWEQLSFRKHLLTDVYPFEIHGDRLRRLPETWRAVPAFVLLLLSDISRSYSSTKISLEPGTNFAKLFEKVVEAAVRGFLGGSSYRFGWPPFGDPPHAGIEVRVGQLADAMNLELEKLAGKLKPKDKDRGLDVATRISFGDDGPGTITLLTQCATGKHWRKKTGQPAVAKWANIIQWNSKLVRAVAIPWQLKDRSDFSENHVHFDGAVILDRIRLLFGNPDRFLDSNTIDPVVDWCQGEITSVPPLREH